MLRTAYRTLTIVLVAFATALPAASATAQSSEGATIFDVDECQPGWDELICLKGRVVLNYTQTPSGWLSVNYHVDIDQTRTGGACEPNGGTDMHHQHTLFNLADFVAQEDHFVARLSSSISCSGGPLYTCDSTVMIHQAGGTFQFDRSRSVCTET
jgi:hypothetical protein